MPQAFYSNSWDAKAGSPIFIASLNFYTACLKQEKKKMLVKRWETVTRTLCLVPVSQALCQWATAGMK